MSSRPHIGIRLVGFLVVTLLAASCGKNDSHSERALNVEEASILAEVLWRNYENGGAHFRLSAQAGIESGTITLDGKIDWTQHHGQAQVFGGAQPNPVEEVWWDDSAVAEWRPDLTDELSGLVTSGMRPIVVRGPDTEHRRLDQLLAVVTGLAAESPENSQLILQTKGSAFIRSDVLRGQQVVLLRYGQRTIYWIDKQSGEMMRFEGINSTGQYPVIVDILDRGSQVIEFPANAESIELASNPDLSHFIPTSP